jgi:hypothetical protein
MIVMASEDGQRYLRRCMVASRSLFWFACAYVVSFSLATWFLGVPRWDLSPFILILLAPQAALASHVALRASLMVLFAMMVWIGLLLVCGVTLVVEGVERYLGFTPLDGTGLVLATLIVIFFGWSLVVLRELYWLVQRHPIRRPKFGFRLLLIGWVLACAFAMPLSWAVWRLRLIDGVQAFRARDVTVAGRELSVHVITAGPEGRQRLVAVVVRPPDTDLELSAMAMVWDGMVGLVDNQQVAEGSLVWWPEQGDPVILELGTGLPAAEPERLQALLLAHREQLVPGPATARSTDAAPVGGG